MRLISINRILVRRLLGIQPLQRAELRELGIILFQIGYGVRPTLDSVILALVVAHEVVELRPFRLLKRAQIVASADKSVILYLHELNLAEVHQLRRVPLPLRRGQRYQAPRHRLWLPFSAACSPAHQHLRHRAHLLVFPFIVLDCV